MASPGAALALAAAAKDPRVRRGAGALVVLVLIAPMGMAVLMLTLLAGAGGASLAPRASSVACAPGQGGRVGAGETFADVDLDAAQVGVAREVLAAVRAFEPTAQNPYAGVVALATALQESSLRNLDYGDRDSLGVFQQRPSQGWGTADQVRDIAYATTMFLERLVDVGGWEDLSLTDAAQAVQRSGFPEAYAKWEPAATQLVEELWPAAGAEPMSAPVSDEETSGQAVVANAGCSGIPVGLAVGVPENCTATGGSAEQGLVPNALAVMRCTLTVFGPHRVSGVGGRPNASDHPNGRAVDVMIDDYDTAAGNAHGWVIAHWIQANAAHFGVTYVIFDDQVWSAGRADEGWRAYCHPNHQSTCGGGDTLRHLDHVHVSVAE
ncbi:hypothetical protein RDV89_17545 [Nocardioides zeae]|uniref:ARB-07466-like C-terminal domain-containing protein n=1 Tax=Nocardioides imazamoxiresistens TaxID=3231893 RepID=A0ABU3Q1I9_9ACTN|nr:hypothetical protein [Nocardioides zeae]MDT9594897.1 hypothetical protein [Nocardioides zeae]